MVLHDKDIKYKVRCMRLSEETWGLLKSRQKKSGKSWNLFLVDLLKGKKNG